ncbi:APH(3') family aminoglycoside O-phosphotransferase [Clostridium sp. Marseille-Q7071]
MYLPKEIKRIVVLMQSEECKEGMSRAKVIRYYDACKEFFLKIEKINDEVIREYDMYQWLIGKLPVPKIVYRVVEDNVSYMLIEAARGKMLEDDGYRSRPEKLVALAAKGIKLLQSVDVYDCPFDSRIDTKLEKAKERIESGLTGRIDKNVYTKGLYTPEDVYRYLIENKPEEELIFSHGDYCFNNYFTNGTEITGFIDMGRAGVSDFYQDIALCVRELMDFEPKYTEMFIKELGIEPNWEKIKYYILLDELF